MSFKTALAPQERVKQTTQNETPHALNFSFLPKMPPGAAYKVIENLSPKDVASLRRTSKGTKEIIPNYEFPFISCINTYYIELNYEGVEELFHTNPQTIYRAEGQIDTQARLQAKISDLIQRTQMVAQSSCGLTNQDEKLVIVEGILFRYLPTSGIEDQKHSTKNIYMKLIGDMFNINTSLKSIYGNIFYRHFCIVGSPFSVPTTISQFSVEYVHQNFKLLESTLIYRIATDVSIPTGNAPLNPFHGKECHELDGNPTFQEMTIDNIDAAFIGLTGVSFLPPSKMLYLFYFCALVAYREYRTVLQGDSFGFFKNRELNHYKTIIDAGETVKKIYMEIFEETEREYNEQDEG